MTDDERARFSALFDQHYAAVLGYAARRSDAHTAQEVAAETFLVAWRRLAHVPGHALPWLLVVARNTLSNHRRGEYRRAVVETEAAWIGRVGTRTSDPADAVGERLDVLSALHALAPADRDTLMLVAWDGLSTRDAAEVAGCSVPTFSVRLHRARARLTAALADPTDGEPARPTVDARTPLTTSEELS